MKILSFRSFTFIILTLVSSFSYAQKAGKIFFDDSKIQVLNSQEKEYVKKSVYQVVYYTKMFDIVIGEFKEGLSKEGSFSVDVIIKPTKLEEDYANITLRLRNLTTQKVINLVKKSKVRKLKVQYTVRKLLFKLFYEENYDDKNDKVLKNKIIPLAQNQKIEGSNSDEAGQEEKESTENTLLADGVSSIDKKTIVKNDDKTSKSEKLKPKKKKKQKVKISNFLSPDIDVSSEENKKVFLPTSFEIHSNFYFNIGQSADETNSSTIIETKTSTKQMRIGFGSRLKIGESKDFYEVGMSLGKIVGENKEKISPSFKLNLEYSLNLYDKYLYLSPNIEYETLSFSDLSTEGEGLVPWNNTLVWFGVRGRIHLFSDFLEMYAGFSKSFIGTSDLGKKSESFPIEGTKVTWGAMTKVYKKWGLGVRADSVSLTSSASSSFKADHQSFLIFLNYK